MKAVFNPFGASDSSYLTNWNDTMLALKSKSSFKTNQMSVMEFAWYEGYSICIVNDCGIEVLISNDSGVTKKDLRPAHNIYRMFHAGAFNLNGV